jgi:alanine dehydrogenase
LSRAVTLVLARRDVEALVRAGGAALHEALLERLAAGYRAMAAGRVYQHERIYLRPPAKGPLARAPRRPPGLFSMAALVPDEGVMGARLHPLGTAGGDGEPVIVLFDARTGACRALLDDTLLHEYRTGAPAALATRCLACPDARVVACIGSGPIARGALTLVCHVLPAVTEVRVFSRTPAHRARFAAELTARLGRPIVVVDSAEAAAYDADVLITATDADRPVVPDAAIKAGAHLNLLARNEIEAATFRRAKVVTTSTAVLLAWDPPWHEPLSPEWVHAELGDILLGRAVGRVAADEVTVFVGSAPVAMWDVVAAAVFTDFARQLGLGTAIGPGG